MAPRATGWSTQRMSVARKGRHRITSLLKYQPRGLGRGTPGAKSTETRCAPAIAFIVLVGMIANCGAVYAKTPRHIRKFDIICSVSGHDYRAYHPELEGYAYAMPDSWAYDFRYRVDLNVGLYTDVGPKDEETKTIASTTRRIITFVKTKDEHETFDLKTRRYRRTATLSAYKDGFASGPCRFARYSGR